MELFCLFFNQFIKDKESLPPVYCISQLSFPHGECCFINIEEKSDSIKAINNIQYAGYYKIM